MFKARDRYGIVATPFASVVTVRRSLQSSGIESGMSAFAR